MPLLKSSLLLAIPLLVFIVGGTLMGHLSGREVSRGLPRDDPRTPLNLRAGGYDAAGAAAHWETMDATRLDQERRFLEIDLVFPFLYGGVFLTALLLAWAAQGRPFAVSWLVVPVVLVVVGDWIENVVQIAQLQRWTAAGGEATAAALGSGWIRAAGLATQVKIGMSFVVLGLLLYLVGRLQMDRLAPG